MIHKYQILISGILVSASLIFMTISNKNIGKYQRFNNSEFIETTSGKIGYIGSIEWSYPPASSYKINYRKPPYSYWPAIYGSEKDE